jgi:hypothetical protein
MILQNSPDLGDPIEPALAGGHPMGLAGSGLWIIVTSTSRHLTYLLSVLLKEAKTAHQMPEQ